MSEQAVSRMPDADMQAAPAALLRADRRARDIARQTGAAVVVARDQERQAAPEPAAPEP
jgi:hypothetical protein